MLDCKYAFIFMQVIKNPINAYIKPCINYWSYVISSDKYWQGRWNQSDWSSFVWTSSRLDNEIHDFSNWFIRGSLRSHHSALFRDQLGQRHPSVAAATLTKTLHPTGFPGTYFVRRILCTGLVILSGTSHGRGLTITKTRTLYHLMCVRKQWEKEWWRVGMRNQLL